MSKTAIWDALGKTDPNHTKGFNRSGGFKGTSIKPMWVYRRLTEQFGPVGEGWGHNRPTFETVFGQEGEVLVYCTVECWHTKRENTFFGVGGDKAIARNKNGLFHDDEAFKKAFTDSVMNAFKSVGVAADIHMGRFDDDKYVQEVAREFTEKPAPITDEQRTELVRLFDATGTNAKPYLERAAKNTGLEIADLRDLPASEFEPLKQHLLTKVPKEGEK